MKPVSRMTIAAAALTLIAAGPAMAQDVRALAADAAPAAATLDDMKGIFGDWIAKDAAAAFSAPVGGQVIGHLLLMNGTTPRVEELWLLRPEGNSVLVRQKHYSPDLKDREAKDVWGERKLVARDAGHLYFENLTFVTKGNTMDLLVRIAGPNGAPPTMLSYSFTRAK